MDRLKKRAEFLAVAGGERTSRRSFVLQKGASAPDDPARAPRFGFTATKKTGNSPERNRVKRRLREAVRLAAAAHTLPATDYVLIARRAALSQPFDLMIADLISSLDALARGVPGVSRSRRDTTGGAPVRPERVDAKD